MPRPRERARERLVEVDCRELREEERAGSCWEKRSRRTVELENNRRIPAVSSVHQMLR